MSRPSARVTAPANPAPLLPEATTHRVVCVRRAGGMWVSEVADIPADVWAQYVVPGKTHGPDLFGMCVGQAEFIMHQVKEYG